MKTYKKKTVKVLDKIHCDCCGENCSKDIGHEYAELSATWGYCSNQDGTQYDIQICETCFNEVLQSMKHIRKRIIGSLKYPHDIDNLEGKSYYFPS
jgi:hypothetical protein